jgi:hypothetical protein
MCLVEIRLWSYFQDNTVVGRVSPPLLVLFFMLTHKKEILHHRHRYHHYFFLYYSSAPLISFTLTIKYVVQPTAIVIHITPSFITRLVSPLGLGNQGALQEPYD